MGKDLLHSKTFWINVVNIAANYGGILPPKYGIPVMAISNIVVRLLTGEKINSVLGVYLPGR